MAGRLWATTARGTARPARLDGASLQGPARGRPRLLHPHRYAAPRNHARRTQPRSGRLDRRRDGRLLCHSCAPPANARRALRAAGPPHRTDRPVAQGSRRSFCQPVGCPWRIRSSLRACFCDAIRACHPGHVSRSSRSTARRPEGRGKPPDVGAVKRRFYWGEATSFRPAFSLYIRPAIKARGRCPPSEKSGGRQRLIKRNPG